jgi:hypothetical protein
MACVVVLWLRSVVDDCINLGLRVTLLMSLRLRLRVGFHRWSRRAGTCVCRCSQLSMIAENVVFMRCCLD